jgi:phosphohistidine phosphatase
MAAAKWLLLIRHAKSSWDNPDWIDFERPLSARGLEEAPRLGRWLRGRLPLPQIWLSSPACRARETARRVRRGMGATIPPLRLRSTLYLATAEEWLHLLRELPESQTSVACVGHNPGLQEVIQCLTGEPLSKLPTATAAALRVAGRWRDLHPGSARLRWLQRAREVAE